MQSKKVNRQNIFRDELIVDTSLYTEFATKRTMSSEEDAVISAVERVAPSVVSISTVQEYRDFFYTRPVQGMGSGVIVHPDGYIATNYHVVQMSEQIVVTNSDGKPIRFFPGRPFCYERSNKRSAQGYKCRRGHI